MGLVTLPLWLSRNTDDFVGDCGTPGDEHVLQMVDRCTYFVLILTKEALKSHFVEKEINRALSTNKIILPYYKKPDLSSKDITNSYAVKGGQRGQFTGKEELAIKVIKKILKIEQESLQALGILQVFENRHCEEYVQAITECIKSLNGGEVRMLGISFKDWFGANEKDKVVTFSQILEDAMSNDVQFRVLLIDPTSDIAKERAIVEGGIDYQDDAKYVGSPLFQDIKKVSNWIKNKQETMRKNNQQPCIEPRFYDFMLSIYAIITPTCSFIEQYHIGNIGGRRAPGDESAICLGGYVPVFKVDNSSHFGTEIVDHFTKIWDHSARDEVSKGNTFENILYNIELLESNPLNFRMQQFTVKNHRRCNNIIDLIKKANGSIKSKY